MPDTDLSRLLASIGKSTFVRFFEDFNNPSISNQDMIARLPAEYTFKSRTSRTSKSRRILREGLEIEALSIVANSDNVDSETTKGANRLLAILKNQ